MGALHAAATAPWVQSLALLCLCAAYLQGGWYKSLNFRGAVAEVKALGLTPAAPIAAAVLVLQLAASALILTGWYRWLGALALAGFTVLAALLADRFWVAPQAERQRAANAFFEHWGLVGGMLLVAWHDLGGSHAG
ncbi:DoxX family protein [Comamonas testosteroni]|uniref:DoxX family protein n=1 Tax=Comamonas testosteroni TaxID=285 RepID=UPI00266057FD|nr:DoxX family protein [Comamonas testosteroni]WKL13689.1 DoxX family protein [Comamonas testosteroni]WQD42722.1 DoxX family protein [Comamonas testosteroni]